MAAQRALVDPADYLFWESQEPVKHEYVQGVVYAMAGASPNHVRITRNLTGVLFNGLEGRECENFDADTKVRIEAPQAFYYPDAMVACPPNFVSDVSGVVDNPTVIFEVLSASTANIDRGPKFGHYRTLASLKEYVLIDSERMRVELFTLHEDTWMVRTYESQFDNVLLRSIEVLLPLSAIYRHVEFR